ncbi:MAG: TAT-variant-translocated molybdopterin oxidoreductase [Planctomycetaceae bacterium]|nr:TAT-variant-translocated molybdopterin oxidoreductase [Planctomycetaceae bacterium]
MYWRSLEQFEETPEFRDFVEREFPVAASEFPAGVSRRRWMQLMGAAFSLASAAGCRWQADQILPFAKRPKDRIPGVPQHFATAHELAGYARNLVVTAFDGRPIKVEGNREHPLSGGATDAISQAIVLDMYDPDRVRGVIEQNGGKVNVRTWDDFASFLSSLIAGARTSGGKGVRILAEASSSPTRQRLQAQLAELLPESKWVTWEAINRDAEIRAAELAFGRPLRAQYDLTKADVIVAFDSDLLGLHPANLKAMREWASRRTPETGSMNRTYVVESQFSTLGIAADHRLPIKSSQIPAYISALEARVDAVLGGESAEVDTTKPLGEQLLAAMAGDLVAAKGHSLVVAGPSLPPEAIARVHRLNEKLGNVGTTVGFIAEPLPVIGESLKPLVDEMAAGSVDVLLVLGGNPVYTAPADLDFAGAMQKVKHRIHLTDGPTGGETAALATWVLPRANPLEAWGDSLAWDGSLSVSQPLIAPLFEGKSDIELLSWMVGGSPVNGLDLVRETQESLSDKEWRKLVHDGFRGETAPAWMSAKVLADLQLPEAPEASEGLEVVFTPGETVFDGRFANNGWLQELPQNLTKMVWNNAAILAPKTAEELGVVIGSMVRVTLGNRSIELPAFVVPGQAIGSVGLALGYGRTAAGRVGGDTRQNVASVGANAFLLRSSGAGAVVQGGKVERIGGSRKMATTQDHHQIDQVGLQEIAGRVPQLVREGVLEEFQHHPDFAQHMVHHPPLESLWTEASFDGYAWGMSIDLSKCVGCNACVTACQAENNVPIVGREQVSRGREMHWIRVDRYFTGDFDNPRVVTQPVTCHHCENAPCEQVCPVGATTHSEEGLNDMAYNRCIGTRYCANNCPYKVRRFNFLDFNKKYEQANTELIQMVLNPEVTVRERGVIEKCTYCVQRIQSSKIVAKNEGRAVRDGEIVTACQQACAANAIEFGDLRNEESKVAKAHANSRAYAMLAELNVKPRTKYLARIRNPHPALGGRFEPTEHGHGHGGHGDDAHAEEGHGHGKAAHGDESKKAESKKAEH